MQKFGQLNFFSKKNVSPFLSLLTLKNNRGQGCNFSAGKKMVA
jgi:hypothetical protein